MKPQRINWKVAAVVGATASMVGAGGFALADEVSGSDDTEPTTTTKSVSIEPARPSAPVLVESDADAIDDSVESVPSADAVVVEVPTDLADPAPSVESIPSVESEPPVSVESVSAPSVSVESVSVESVSAPSVSVESVSVESVSVESVSVESVSVESGD